MIQHFHFTFGDHTVLNSTPQSHTKRLFEWLKAVLPEYNATEYKPEDWSDGKLLASLLTSCTGNQCQTSKLEELIAEIESTVGIPPILQPSDLLTHSGAFVLLTYLYFFAKPGSPSQLKLMKWSNTLQATPVKDFQHGWEPGRSVYEAVHCLLPHAIPSLDTVANLHPLQMTQEAVSAAERTLPILPATDHSAICYPATDPFPLILFLSQLQSVKNIHRYSLPSSLVIVRKDVKCLYAVGSSVSIELETCDSPYIPLKAVIESKVSEERIILNSERDPGNGFTSFSYIPNHAGVFQMIITCEGNEIPDSPITFDVYDSQQCQIVTPVQSVYSLGQPITLQVSSTNAGKGKLSAILDAPGLQQPPSTVSPQAILPTDEAVIPHATLPQANAVIPQSISPQASAAIPRVIADHTTFPKATPLAASQDDSFTLQPPRIENDSFSVASIKLQGVVSSKDPCLHELSFTPKATGGHSLYIYWNGSLIPSCPISITVSFHGFMVQGRGVEEAFEGLESDFDIIVPHEVALDSSKLAVHITYRNIKVKEEIKMLRDADKQKYR